MTDRHFFGNDHKDIVARSLKGLAATHPHLSIIPSLKICYHANHDPTKVALLCGGGSGHEPGTVGFVGKGLLSASVAGDVFASPSAKQVIGGIKAVPSDKGTILIITNYTGDNLHFGLARLMAHGQGIKNVELVVVGDDVSVPRSRGEMVGRRCLAGITLVCKILGAGSEEGMGFQELIDLGRSTSTNTGSICMALNHCHIAGRTGDWQIPEGRVEIGLGLHNETGMFNIAQPSGEAMITQMLDLILNQEDPERAFVKFKKDDELVLLVNNQGGLSNLEMGAVVNETLDQLEAQGIIPKRVFQGCFMGSMNMPGVSLSLTNLTNISDDTGIATSRLLELIDAPHTSFAWPATQNIYPLPTKLEGRKRQDAFTEVEDEGKHAIPAGPKLQTSAGTIQKAMKQAAEDSIAMEPKLTEWDTIVGDGDAGEYEYLSPGGQAVLAAMEKDSLGADGDLVRYFRELTEVIEGSMGGTFGAILSILLAGMTTAVIDAASSESKPSINAKFFGQICLSGVEALKARTAARIGHRTCMDAIIPFADTLAETWDLQKAVAACKKGTDATVTMQAKLGRAVYVGEREDRLELPVDPGAAAFLAVVEGILKAVA